MRSIPLPLWALGLVSALAYFHNLNIALFEGSEGLYAHIAREMVQTQHYLQLTYQGEPYANKTPLYFWLLAFSTTLLGDSEFALRFPAALFSVGTVVLTYYLGKSLFSPRVAFWAALVVASNHVFLWYGRRVLFDSALTFSITLALFAWIRASFPPARPRWYLMSFLAMAFGTMIKGYQAAALPALLVVLYSFAQRDFRAWRERSFWIGLLVFVCLTNWYFSLLDNQSSFHSDLAANLTRLLNFSDPTLWFFSDRPIYWYLEVMWFDFFPWSALIPSAFILLLSQRPFRNHPSHLFVILWFVGFFVAVSLYQGRREPYLMPMVPALGLMIGCFYDAVFSSGIPKRWATPLVKITLGAVSVAYLLALLIGPSLLEGRWNVPSTLFPLFYLIPMIALALFLIFLLVKSQMRAALTTFGIMAAGFVLGVIHIVLPAIDESISAKRVGEEIKLIAKSSENPVVLYSPGWPNNEDVVYYLSLEPTLPRIGSEQALMDSVRKTGHLVVAVDKTRFIALHERSGLKTDLLREFRQPGKKSFYLLSIREAASNRT